jgi:glycosyltransferase involved in cell wall biosynthesis
MREAPVVALDCRWLGLGGAGRVTEKLLEGLAATHSDDGCVAWRFWDGRSLATDSPRAPADSPARLAGQASLTRQPSDCDLIFFMHQMRPLVARRNVTLIHDTIPLLCATSRRSFVARRAFYRRVARTSARIVTVSTWSRDQIVDSLRVPPARVSVVPPPGLDRLAGAMSELRERSPTEEYLLYVGAIQPHKNLPRLISAFSRSRYARDGGRLVLVGGSAPDMTALRADAHDAVGPGIELRAACSDADLVRLYAGCRAVVQPSLWEGFGLPAREALASGIPVIGSTGGALADVADLFVARFDPESTDEMTGAIDDGVEQASADAREAAHRRALQLAERTGSPASFARTIRETCLAAAT